MAWLLRRNCQHALLAFFLLLSAAASSAACFGLPAKSCRSTAASSQERGAGPLGNQDAPETLLELIVAGGPVNIGFLSVLGLFSLVGLAVILERLWNLTARKLVPAGFVSELQELVRRQEDNPRPFQSLCRRYPSVARTSSRQVCCGPAGRCSRSRRAMEDAAARELGVLRSSVRPLTVLSSAGPLVGLLGTAVGMILVFRTVSQSGLGEAKLLAEGIYLKLETTVAGLIVAIPSLLFAALFNSRSEKLLRRIDECLMETIPCFIRMARPADGSNGKLEVTRQELGRILICHV